MRPSNPDDHLPAAAVKSRDDRARSRALDEISATLRADLARVAEVAFH
jgi:hypothetical protein